MIARALVVALAVVAVPIAVNGAERPKSRSSDYYTKKICEVHGETGSRLGAVRRCRTRSERDAAKAENRQVMDRVQSMKPTVCGLAGADC